MNLDWHYFEQKYPVLTTSLLNARSAGRLAHAHLLISSNIQYRLAFPPLLASLAACENPGPDFRPCGKCQTCRELLNGTYPDAYTLAPSSKSRQIQIGEADDDPDTLRWFESLFFLSSMTRSGWKIGVIQEADRLTEQAQNAFLKTLEEPPEKCMFVLATAHPSGLLPTIKSRCQLIQMVDNASTYDFPSLDRLTSLLNELTFQAKNDLVRTEDCAVGLVDMLADMEKQAEKTVAAKWAEKEKSAKAYLEKAGQTLLERRIKGEESCEYLRLRETFLSALHTFFAQLVLLVSGTEPAHLPNPELLRPPFDPAAALAIPPDDAFRFMGYAEDLLQALRTNANDELAIRSFVLKVACK